MGRLARINSRRAKEGLGPVHDSKVSAARTIQKRLDVATIKMLQGRIRNDNHDAVEEQKSE